jgi:hypothetical protein
MKDNKREEKVKPAPITSLAGLQAAVGLALSCDFEIDGKPVKLAVNRINGLVDEQRRAIMRVPVPPFVKERNDYDLLNPAYRKQKEQAEDVARSLVVYHCCPAVQEGNRGLHDPETIHNYVKGALPPVILEMIALTAMGSGLTREVSQRADFI